MEKNKTVFAGKLGLLLVTALTIITTAMVNFNVQVYGDDFFYKCFTSRDLNYFISRHIQHYFLANGRVIVHLLATVFLGLNLTYWRVINSMILGFIVYFGAKTALDTEITDHFDYTNTIWAGILFAAAIAFLDPNITRQSIYWLTGSFNYGYPLMMLLIYWYLLNRTGSDGKFKSLLPFIAFFASATTEQVSLMTVGLTLIGIIHRMIIKKIKIEKYLLISFILAVIGMLSVICAPSVAYRASIEDAPASGFLSLIKYNFLHQSITFLFSRMMMPYQLISMLCAIGIILKYSNVLQTPKGYINKILIIISVSTVFCWLWIMITKSNPIVKLGTRELFFYLFIGFGYVLLLLYAAILVYFKKLIQNNLLPVSAIILCFGSQFMMLISPVYGPRNLLCAIITLTLYSASLTPLMNKTYISAILGVMVCYLFNIPYIIPLPFVAFLLIRRSHIKIGNAIAYFSIYLVAFSVLYGTIIGYAINAPVYEKNLRTAAQYKNQNEKGELLQERLPNDTYGWVMPYQNSYYNPYYKQFLSLRPKTEIHWIEHR